MMCGDLDKPAPTGWPGNVLPPTPRQVGASQCPKKGPLSSNDHLRGKHVRILRPGVARRPQNGGFAKPCRSKLLEEGAAFLRSSDSGKPVLLALLNLWGNRFAQYELGHINCATRAHYSCELAEDCVPDRVQVEDAVDQSYVN